MIDKQTIKTYLIEKRPKTLQINDLVSLFCKDKKVVYTTIETKEDAKTMKELCEMFKFKKIVIKESGKNVFNESNEDILIGTDIKKMEKAKKLYLADRIVEWGIYLGYPQCCVKEYGIWHNNIYNGYYPLIKHIFSKSLKYKKIPFYINNVTNFYSRVNSTPQRELFKKYINENRPFFEKGIDFEPFITWHPCSYTCKESLKRGENIYNFMKEYLPNRTHRTKTTLSKSILFKDDFEFLIPNSNATTLRNELTIEVDFKEIISVPKTFITIKMKKKIEKYNKIISINGKIIKPDFLSDFILIPFGD